jgi:hypothetical protein
MVRVEGYGIAAGATICAGRITPPGATTITHGSAGESEIRRHLVEFIGVLADFRWWKQRDNCGENSTITAGYQRN